MHCTSSDDLSCQIMGKMQAAVNYSPFFGGFFSYHGLPNPLFLFWQKLIWQKIVTCKCLFQYWVMNISIEGVQMAKRCLWTIAISFRFTNGIFLLYIPTFARVEKSGYGSPGNNVTSAPK